MIQRKTRWGVAPWNESKEAAARAVSEALKVPPLVAKLLVQRGYEDKESAERFLYGNEEHLHDPYLLHGMAAAVERIRAAQASAERVRIYGDYDADGVSSTSLLVHLFRAMDLQFDYYIPHRSLEGYGLNRNAIDLAASAGVTLIVTVDTGISAYDEIAYAKEQGIDVVVTDHHEPPELLPDACAIVNPKQEHCAYPFKGLAGVGVAFKLATALLERPPLEWADIVSLGTIADLMPLVDENRIFVRYGIQKLKTEAGVGFRALAEACGLELGSVTSTSVAFGMAPRVNAAGRLDHAHRAVELLTTRDYDEAILAALGLDSLNKERQRIVEEIVKEAEEEWRRQCALAEADGKESPAVIVLAGVGWNVGVIGIVASKLLERYYKPVIILGINTETGMCKGSARSIDGFDMYAALTKCEEWLDHYGGHQAAAGMSLHRDNVQPFAERMSLLALEWLVPDDWIPKTAIDFHCGVEEATLETIAQLALLEPFGKGNPSPRLLFKDAPLIEKRALGKDAKHMKLLLAKDRKRLDAIGFGMGEMVRLLQPGAVIDAVGELSINEWNGQRKPQLQLYDVHYEPDRLDIFPSREQFGQVFQLLRRAGGLKAHGIEEQLAARCGLTTPVIRLMLDVFEELNFVERRNGELVVAPSPEKRDLATSERYAAAKARFQHSEAKVFA